MKCLTLLKLYFPYHEMDETAVIIIFKEKILKKSIVKELRELNQLSQNDLSILSGVSIRSIRA